MLLIPIRSALCRCRLRVFRRVLADHFPLHLGGFLKRDVARRLSASRSDADHEDAEQSAEQEKDHESGHAGSFQKVEEDAGLEHIHSHSQLLITIDISQCKRQPPRTDWQRAFRTSSSESGLFSSEPG